MHHICQWRRQDFRGGALPLKDLHPFAGVGRSIHRMRTNIKFEKTIKLLEKEPSFQNYQHFYRPNIYFPRKVSKNPKLFYINV